MERIWYPSVKQVISYNKIIIKRFKNTKAEQHKVLNRKQIENAIKETKRFPGSIEDKAAMLVRELQYHPFASGNRRTAYFTMNIFLWKNKKYGILKKKKSGRQFMEKVRKGELSHQEIVEEIKFEK